MYGTREQRDGLDDGMQVDVDSPQASDMIDKNAAIGRLHMKRSALVSHPDARGARETVELFRLMSGLLHMSTNDVSGTRQKRRDEEMHSPCHNHAASRNRQVRRRRPPAGLVFQGKTPSGPGGST